MMDQIAGLVQRGIISPDAAQGLVQQVADLKNRMPFESGGGAPTNSVYVPRSYRNVVEPSYPLADSPKNYEFINKVGKDYLKGEQSSAAKVNRPYGFWNEGGEGYNALKDHIEGGGSGADFARDWGMQRQIVNRMVRERGFTNKSTE